MSTGDTFDRKYAAQQARRAVEAGDTPVMTGIEDDLTRVLLDALRVELPLDSTGHVPECGYDDEADCGCFTLIRRIAAVLAPVVAKHVAAGQERALLDAARQMQDGIGEAYNPAVVDYEQQRHEARARRQWLRDRAATYTTTEGNES